MFVFAILKSKIPRIIGSALVVVSLAVFIFMDVTNKPFEAYNNTFISENNIVFVGEPHISAYADEAQGEAELINNGSGYTVKMTGQKGKKYTFEISDDKNTYSFEYHYDDVTQPVVVVKE